MKRLFRYALIAMLCLPMLAMGADWKAPTDLAAEKEAPAALLPFPREVTWKDESLALPKKKGWEMRARKGIKKLPMVKVAWEGLMDDAPSGKGDSVTVTLRINKKQFDDKTSAEGYRLQVTPKGVQITAAEEAGLFYGLQTLRQMVKAKKLRCCSIVDSPAFRYRGYMQDCGRNYRTVARLKKELDMAAQVKVNVFHWHLTDYPAWRIQCKSYPELNSPKYRTRDLNDTYSYDDIREVCEYAAKRNILVIPELDMPGHSAYFEKAFGFKMHTEKGMPIVKKLLEEFCEEIPTEMCPIVHFGADEVRIPNAAEFVGMVTKTLLDHKRTPVQWASNRDLPVADTSIEQRWGEGADMAAKSIIPSRITRRAFDSTMGYANLVDPALLVRRYFFMRPCGVGEGDAQKLGSIICIWPDGRVENKELIPGFCAMWPGICAMAERSWVGGASDGDALPMDMPGKDTEAWQAYSSFSKRMLKLRKSIFDKEDFPYWYECDVQWKLYGPVATAQAAASRQNVLDGKPGNLSTRETYCANIYFRTRPDTGYLGMFQKARKDQTIWAVTELEAEKSGDAKFMVGFDAPARSNRRWTGVPDNGSWSQCGARIWINGKEVRNPRTYKLAGQRKHPGNAWNFENPPLDPEEIWWSQDPVELPLKKGKNTVVIEIPYIGEHQSWGVSLIPLN